MLRRHAVFSLLVAMTGPLAALAQTPIAGLQPANPAPAADKLAPGLAVNYHFDFIDRMAQFNEKGKTVGAPLTHLGWDMKSGNVLTTEKKEGVQAHIFGYIRFAAAGTYIFEVNSNDGVRLEIGGKRIWEDPDVHADRMSPPLQVQVPAPGLYPIKILYFQKKGTATLEVFWAAPGGQRTVIAGDALVHLKR
ncbi:MAG TPA: PA14 domain-containing protein [Vineibacter sp.]|nr:PA14 domain-containing protein [Vineibacter sp.]